MCLLLLVIGHKCDKGNIKSLIMFWLILLVMPILTITETIKGSSYYFYCIVSGSAVILIRHFLFTPIRILLMHLLALNLAFWFCMNIDYKFEWYSYFDKHYYKIGILLMIAQFMAAIDGDTGFFRKLYRLALIRISSFASNLFCMQARSWSK